jgi:hypothetical protein
MDTNPTDFTTSSGSVSITSNSGSFSITPNADVRTDGAGTVTVTLRSGSISGTTLATSTVTINDTSLDPVPPFSLEFTGDAGARRLAVQYFQSDWNLNDTWTIEFWSKANGAIGNGPQTVMSQHPASSSIDVHYLSGNLVMSNDITLCAEPPRGSIPTTVTGIGSGTGSWEGNQGSNIATTGGTGTGLTVDVVAAGSGYAGAVYIHTAGSGYSDGDVITATNGTYNGGSSVSFTITVSQPEWTHVAISSNAGLVKVYYNGIQQSSAQRNLALTDSTRDLYIGRRGNNNYQYFNGELALIRISEVARYATAFSPSISYGVDADTLLFLGTNNPLADLSTYQLNGLTTVASNGGTLYFAKSAYPDLDKQIQVGNTVVNPVTSASAIVTAAVYTPDGDPGNWGVNVSPVFVTAVNTANFSGIRHTVTNTGVVRTNDVPSFQSLVFNYPQQDYLVTPASADWNLGSTWTIEFWINANNGSLDGINIPGGQWGLFNQGGWFGGLPANSIIIGLAGGKLTVGQGNTDDAIEFAEPTAQQWTHVAVVNNGGGSAQKVYYNGVEQAKVTGNYLSNGWTNATDPLYIGRLAPGYNSPFDGKMAMIRISNTAEYLATFSPTTTYGVEADTVLFLDKVNPLGDSSASDHVITNNGVTTSTSFPT